jgi:amidase
MHELLRRPAREVVGLLAKREVRPAELVELALARIAEADPAVNAVPTLCPERAMERARAIEAGRRLRTAAAGWAACRW